jgi:hypothetical protein
MLTEMRPFREKKRYGSCHVLADSLRKMFLKAVGKPLGTAKRMNVSSWEMPKNYWKACGHFLRVQEAPGNAQIPAVSQ